MPELPPPPAPRRSRWWVRLAWWLAGFVALGLVLVSCAVFWLWDHQTEAVNGMLERLPMPVTAKVKQVKVSPSKVAMKDVTLHDPTTGRPWLTLKDVTWTPEWKDVPRGVIGTLQVKGALLDLDRATYEALTKPVEGDVAEAEAGGLPFALAKLALDDVHVKVAARPGMPAFEFDLEQHATGLDGGSPAIESFTTTIRNAVIGETKEVALGSLTVEGALRSKDGVLQIKSVVCDGGHLTPSKALLALLEPAPKTSAKPGTSPIKGLELISATLQDFELHAPPGVTMPAWWPQVKGKVSGSINDVAWTEATGLKMGPQNLELANVELKPPTGPGLISIPKGTLSMEGIHAGKLHILGGELEKLIVDWTPELEAWLMPKPAQPAAPFVGPPAPGLTTVVDGFTVRDAALSLKRTPTMDYEGQAHLDVELAALTLSDSGWASVKPQKLAVRDLSVAEHPASKVKARNPFAKLTSGSLQIVPDEWAKTGNVDEFTLVNPIVRLRTDNVSWFDETPPAASSVEEEDDSDEVPWYERIGFDRLSITGGDCDLAFALPEALELRAQFSVATDDKSHIHRFDLRQVKGMLPHLAKLPVAGVEKAELAVQLPGVWKSKHIEALSIKGVQLEVGDALMTLEREEAKEDEEEEKRHPTVDFVGPPEPSPLKDWLVGKLSIDDASVTLQRVAPGLPPMKFDIDYEANEMPLDPAQLSGNFKPQRIEMTQLAIKSPYNPLREVANLDTIFIDFTLDGIFRQRIDQIEIVSPTLNVGEDLFWYIDYYRKFVAGQPLPKTGPQMVDASHFAALEAATALAAAPAKETHSWSVNTLKVHAGKLVIAPKGVPLPGIPRPFPFSFESTLDKGQIEAEFEIPSDTYVWEELKLALEGMSGHVLFNLPVKGQDNNLTETFNVDRIRFKQLHIEQSHLSVTYDVNGIYGKFGGSAYEGYVNGAFNVYLDDTFSWDGWISGIGVRSTEITQKISPAYFLLDGKVDLTLVAQGNMHELYQADVKFKNASPGRFSIQALNDALKSIPSDSPKYQQDIMRIGVETVRDFDYDKVDGECRFYGREGKGHLHFLGPTGSRNIDLNVYDHRWNPVKPPPSSPKTVKHEVETE